MGIVAIAIGFYDDESKKRDIDGILKDLDGIDIDIKNICFLFRDRMNYTVFPKYNVDKGIKQYWTKREIMRLLESKAKHLANNIHHYDGLVVIIRKFPNMISTVFFQI